MRRDIANFARYTVYVSYYMLGSEDDASRSWFLLTKWSRHLNVLFPASEAFWSGRPYVLKCKTIILKCHECLERAIVGKRPTRRKTMSSNSLVVEKISGRIPCRRRHSPCRRKSMSNSSTNMLRRVDIFIVFRLGQILCTFATINSTIKSNQISLYYPRLTNATIDNGLQR